MANRIYEEYKDFNSNPNGNCGITVGLANDKSIYDWKVTLTGPKESFYKGGLFILNVHFPPDYPNTAPEVCFLTPIYHVNVNPIAPKQGEGQSLGHVCISTLNWWKPEYKMREVLLNIYSLFYMANPDSAYGLDRAREYNNEIEVYAEKAKFFTKKYANPKDPNQPKIDRNQDWDFTIG